MIEMTLSSRHRIRNSIPGGLRPSTLPLGHGGSPRYVVVQCGNVWERQKSDKVQFSYMIKRHLVIAENTVLHANHLVNTKLSINDMPPRVLLIEKNRKLPQTL